jgi:hypothetical protein
LHNQYLYESLKLLFKESNFDLFKEIISNDKIKLKLENEIISLISLAIEKNEPLMLKYLMMIDFIYFLNTRLIKGL